MKHIAPVIAAFIGGCTLPAPAVEWDGAGSIKLTAEEAAQCRAQGGCIVVTVQVLQAVVEAAQDCRRKGSI